MVNIELNRIPKTGLVIDETVSFNDDFIGSTDIQRLDNVKIKGQLYYDLNDELIIDLEANGEMVLNDAVDLSPIDYPFTVKITEKYNIDLENDQNKHNSLDIMMIVWQNIVLEIPIRVVKPSNEQTSLQGEGWELISEETKKIDSRLAPLLDLLEKGKE